MKGNKNMVLLMLLLTVAVMITGCGSKMKTSEEITAEHAILIEENVIDDEPVISTKSFSLVKDVTIEKVERTIIEDGEGNNDTSYDTYLVSDVSLSKGTDKTDNYAKAMADGEFDESLIESADFEEAFGTSYAGKDGQELLKDLLTANGFSTDFDGLTFDKDTYELTGQNTYFLKDCAVLEKLLDADAAEVIKKEAYVQVMKDKDGNTVPEFFSAQVQYKKEGKTVTKSVYLQVMANDYSSREEV